MSKEEEKQDNSWRGKVKRLIQSSASATVLYFIIKIPILWILTDLFHIHYLISGAMSGAALTLFQFIPNEFWVWKGKKNPKAGLIKCPHCNKGIQT